MPPPPPLPIRSFGAGAQADDAVLFVERVDDTPVATHVMKHGVNKFSQILAIRLSFEHWRVYLHGAARIDLLSDHKPLVALAQSTTLTPMLARWLDYRLLSAIHAVLTLCIHQRHG